MRIFKTSYLIYLVAAGIFRLLLCKKSYTLYICIIFSNIVSVQTKINDTITHDGYSGISIYDFIENYKDSVIIDSTILSIRKQGLNCFSDHGGSFDWFYCNMCFNENNVLQKHYFLRDIPECFSGRTHHYGRSIDQGEINDDKYYLNGNLIKWIKAEELKNSVEGKSYVWIHIYEVQVE